METHANKFTRRISLYIAVIAMIILLTYIADVVAGQGKTGFLPLSASQRGIIFGMSSIILFFVAIGVGIKEKSKLTGAVVIVGGAIMGTSVLVGSASSEGGLMAISSSFLGVVIVGYVILGLGVFMIIRKN
jgi:hypothetical protein